MAMFKSFRLIILCGAMCPGFLPPLNRSACGQSLPVSAEEVREYEVLVNGKRGGSTTTSSGEGEKGLATAVTDAAVTLDFVVYTYRYEYHGHEAWRGNQLIAVEARATDGGKKLAASARNDGQGST